MSCRTTKDQTGHNLIASGVPSDMAVAVRRRWEMMEDEYLLYRLNNTINSFRQKIKGYKFFAAAKPDGQAANNLPYLQEQLARYESEGFNEEEIQRRREEYAIEIKIAIRTGRHIPDCILNQRKEFRTAYNRRKGQKKAFRTATGNDTGIVDDSMQSSRGYKVKRQDGKKPTKVQLAEIQQGMDEVEDTIGPLADICRKIDLTFIHTNGKRPYQSVSAGGTYTLQYRTITVGVKWHGPTNSAPCHGHELAHMLDGEAGLRLTGIAREQARSSTFLSHLDQDEKTGSAFLINQARKTMNLTRQWETDDDPLPLTDYERLSLEIWARLVEQYISTKLARQGVKPEYVSVWRDLEGQRLYWSKKNWQPLEPLVKNEIKKRLRILRADEQELARLRREPRVSKPSRKYVEGIGNRKHVVIYSGYGDQQERLYVVSEKGKWGIYALSYSLQEGQKRQALSSTDLTQKEAVQLACQLLSQQQETISL